MASDIFELKSADVALRIKGVDYKLVDPPFPKKVQVLKEQKQLEEKAEAIPTVEYLEAIQELNTKTMKLHIPDLPVDVIRSLGQRESAVLLDKLMELSQGHFGAKIEKVEKN